jgi:hypothetical protein
MKWFYLPVILHDSAARMQLWFVYLPCTLLPKRHPCFVEVNITIT